MNPISENRQYQKHQQLIEIYQRDQKNRIISNDDLLSEDIQALHRNHQFVRDDEVDEKLINTSWEIRMARKYYNQLFKEYAVGDFSRYQEGKIGLRWRVESEVLNGKGQFICGNLACTENSNLSSYEVPFRYCENGVIKHELVKIRVCEDCAVKLFYKKLQSASIENKKKDKKKKKRKHHVDSDEDSKIDKSRSIRRREELPPPEDSTLPSTIASVKAESMAAKNLADFPKEKDTFGMEDYLKDLFF